MKDRQKTVLLRWSLTGVGILFAVILAAEGIGALGTQKIDTTQGLEIIQKAETADITMIENKIASLEASSAQTDADTNEEPVDTRSTKEKFDSSVIMGDSVALGFSEYEILNDSSVVAQIGGRITNEDAVKEQITQASEMNPQMLFLCYGLNDIVDSSISKEDFLTSYKKTIVYIQNELPDTKIFVNSIFPVSEEVEAENERMKLIEEFNQGLRELCDKKQIAFLDNTDLVKSQYYEMDGIHFKAEFYNIWADRIAEVAEL